MENTTAYLERSEEPPPTLHEVNDQMVTNSYNGKVNHEAVRIYSNATTPPSPRHPRQDSKPTRLNPRSAASLEATSRGTPNF
jgi:hypothetical protein